MRWARNIFAIFNRCDMDRLFLVRFQDGLSSSERDATIDLLRVQGKRLGIEFLILSSGVQVERASESRFSR